MLKDRIKFLIFHVITLQVANSVLKKLLDVLSIIIFSSCQMQNLNIFRSVC